MFVFGICNIDLEGVFVVVVIGNFGMVFIDLSEEGVFELKLKIGFGLFMLCDVSLRNNLVFGVDYYCVNEVFIVNMVLFEILFFVG